MTTNPSLRDRKKAATRAALSAAAIKLGRCVGFEVVTAEAIAAEAGVSTRTFHNYFSSKEEAALHYLEEGALEWVQLLKQRPADEPLWNSLRHIVLGIIDDPERDIHETMEVAKMVESTPNLLARKLELDSTLSQAFTDAIAERVGMDSQADLYPRMLQSIIGAAVSAALVLWESGNSHASSARELVEQSLAQLERGFITPVLLNRT